MKFTAAIFALAATALASPWPAMELADLTAPTIPRNITACGQTCIKNMYFTANKKLGCTGDKVLPSCLCKKQDFFYGLRDCTKQACGAVGQKQVLDWYKLALCK